MLKHSATGINAKTLQANMNLTQPIALSAGVLDSTGCLHHRDHIELIARSVHQLVKDHADKLSSANGMTRGQLSEAIHLRPALIDLAVTKLLSEKALVLHQQQLYLPSHIHKLSGPTTNLWRSVEPVLTKKLTKPPVLHELAKQLSLPLQTMEKLLTDCQQHGLVRRPIKNRFFLPAALKVFREHAMQLATNSSDGAFSIIAFRDKTAIGRNLSIEILEYFDSLGFTKRLGDKRIIQDKSR